MLRDVLKKMLHDFININIAVPCMGICTISIVAQLIKARYGPVLNTAFLSAAWIQLLVIYPCLVVAWISGTKHMIPRFWCMPLLSLMHDEVMAWKRWWGDSTCHKGPVIMMTPSNGNNFRVTGLLYGKFTGHRWIPRTKATDAELWCFLLSAPEPTAKQTMETLVIWDPTALIMTSLWWYRASCSLSCQHEQGTNAATITMMTIFLASWRLILLTHRAWNHLLDNSLDVVIQNR